jgi:hypothetical protein
VWRQKERDKQEEESEHVRRQERERVWLRNLTRGLEQHRRRREEGDEGERVDEGGLV